MTNSFNGMQLTSKGIALIQAKPDGTPLQASIEETVTDNTGSDLDASTYTRIGALGGFTRSIS